MSDFSTTNITIKTTQEQRPLIENVTSNNLPDANPPPFNRLYPELNVSLHYEGSPNLFLGLDDRPHHSKTS